LVIYDDERCLSRYRELREAEPRWFDNPAGCPTEILFDDAEIREAQRAVRAEREAAREPIEDLRVGILAEDQYIGYVVRDAVRFSDGRYGLYNRVAAAGGVVVLPILGDAIALIRIFRHAPRRWFFEAPQGLLSPGHDAAETARRELIEEMGATPIDLTPLGVVYTSTALTAENLKVFAARISATGAPQASEGIASIRLVRNDEIDGLIVDGTICDGPTTTAITRARIRGFL